MASVSAKWVKRGPGTSSFHPTMTIHGRFYHYIEALRPHEHITPTFLSVYIHDTEHKKQARMRAEGSSKLNEGLMLSLTGMLHETNTYGQTLGSLREWSEGDNKPDEYRMVIHSDKRRTNEHAKGYNGPTASDVAAIIPGCNNGQISGRYIVLRKCGNVNSNGNQVLDNIQITHLSYDPVSYSLILLYGTDGWHPEMNKTVGDSSKKISSFQFYSYYLFKRDWVSNFTV